MTQVKICGNTNAEDAKLALDLGADYLGFIFAPSKRKVDKETVQAILDQLGDFDRSVAVFYNQSKEEVEEAIEGLNIRILQFHGEETARYCDSFMKKGYQVIKTFRVKDAMSLKRVDQYNVNSFLFDTYSKDQAGGTGQTFDWNLLKEKTFVSDQLFLAGGLTPDNLADAIETVHPYAVDVASGVESSPGKKDPELLKKFIQIAKAGQEQNEQKGSIRS